jgi:hypothetical protein
MIETIVLVALMIVVTIKTMKVDISRMLEWRFHSSNIKQEGRVQIQVHIFELIVRSNKVELLVHCSSQPIGLQLARMIDKSQFLHSRCSIGHRGKVQQLLRMFELSGHKNKDPR